MANYKGHIVGALAVNAGYVALLKVAPNNVLTRTHGLLSDWQMLIGLFVLAVLFGLFPDIDTNSKGQNIFYGLALIVDIILIVNGRVEAAAYLGLLAMMPVVGKHRGWTHSFPAMILVPLPIVAVAYLYRPSALTPALILYGAAEAGYFSHLLLDGLVFKHFRVRN